MSEPAVSETPEQAPEFADVAGGLRWRAEEPFLARRATNPMRSAEYAVRDHAEAELAVFFFAQEGGPIQDNIDRWLEQFEQPDGRASRDVATIERATVNDLPVTLVDVSGTFRGMRGMAQGGPARPGWRMLGAIAEGPQGPVFFKLTGPSAAIDIAEPAFRRLVDSIEPQ